MSPAICCERSIAVVYLDRKAATVRILNIPVPDHPYTDVTGPDVSIGL